MTIRGLLSTVLCACCWAACVRVGVAQDDAAPGVSPGPAYTLHVYEDLVQVTALVLSPPRQANTQLQPADFSLQLDAGPVFHPRHLRMEGDDPLSLALVVDESWIGAEETTKELGEAWARLPPSLFTTRDRVSLFAFDCNLLMAAREVPALSPVIPALFPKVLRTDALHKAADGKGRCGKRVPLWDALAQVGRQMEGTSGRRVLVVLSPGIDQGSVNRPDILRHSLAGEGATVFGAVPAEFRGLSVNTFADHESPFALLCGGTGGLIAAVNRGALTSWLGETLRLLRERYVLEFARPANESAGLHQLDVKTGKQSDRVYVSGVTVPLRDEKLARDPNTVPNAPDRAPVVGTRKMVQPH